MKPLISPPLPSWRISSSWTKQSETVSNIVSVPPWSLCRSTSQTLGRTPGRRMGTRWYRSYRWTWRCQGGHRASSRHSTPQCWSGKCHRTFRQHCGRGGMSNGLNKKYLLDLAETWSVFKASALWADAFYKSKCPYVCLCVCLCVCVCVHFWGTV